jgi:putative hydrolase of the HAD superfamily
MHTAIIFDLFHTLVSPEDFWPADYSREHAAAQAMGIDTAYLAEYWGGPGRSRYLNRSVGDLLRDAAHGTGVKVGDESLAAAVKMYGRYHDDALTDPRTDVVRGLDVLKGAGYRLALLSNADDREVARWPRSPLSELIPIACFSYQIGAAKPAPEAYRAVLDQLGSHARSVVFVGDGGSQEFEGARGAGIEKIVCVTGFGTDDGLRTHRAIKEAGALANAVVSSIAEIPSIIATL